MVVFDTSVLAIAFDEKAAVPLDVETGQPIDKCRERINHLIHSLNEASERILIATPVLAEYLVKAGQDRDERLQAIVNAKVFVVAEFDIRAAIECAMLEEGNQPPNSDTESKAKVKFDRQIIAIAKAREATTIYTGDKGMGSRALGAGINVVMTWEIPLPPVDAQMEIELHEPENKSTE